MGKAYVACKMSVVPYIGTWIETVTENTNETTGRVVPYIGTWIETCIMCKSINSSYVVPYIGTWIETEVKQAEKTMRKGSYLI